VDALLAQEGTLRFSLLAVVIAAIAAWEAAGPRRASSTPLRARWRANFAVWLLDNVMLRLVGPPLAVATAIIVAERGGGVLALLGTPWWLAFAGSLLVLDLGKYVEHRLFHGIPFLWRIHRMHHADPEYDFTVGLRFHPLEALVSTSLTALIIVALGAPPAAVLLHQLLTITQNVVAHGNVRMPIVVDALLRRVVVTPDLHRVHHSAAMRESNSNLGNIFPWWDRLFGTYVDQPAAGHDRMQIGLGGPSELRHVQLRWMLLDPFTAAERAPARTRFADVAATAARRPRR
jgi:sterol desaturase/sphingolipid hydroxylase (fatty acid hydroxylase superfamily)